VTGGLLLEQRWPFERAALLTDPVHFGRGVPHGTGQPVLLIPGFLAGDASLLTLTRWLRRIGYEPVRAGLRVNAGCAGATVDRLAGLLREVAASKGPVALIGQSRGGLLGRALALRERERVAGLVTLGSPLLDERAVHPNVWRTGAALARLGDRGVPGLLTSDCADGPCCARYRRERRARFPGDVGFVSLYSRRDGIVDWHACLDPGARHVEVASSHAGMGAEVSAYIAIAHALRSFWPRWRRSVAPSGSSPS
jgi:triacylglycerol lipase